MQSIKRDNKRSFRVQILKSQLQRLFNYRIHLAFILVRASTRKGKSSSPSLSVFGGLVDSRLKLSLKKIKSFGALRAAKIFSLTVKREFKRSEVSIWQFFHLWKSKSISLPIKRLYVASRLLRRALLRESLSMIGQTTLRRSRSAFLGKILIRLETRMAISAWKISQWPKRGVLWLCFRKLKQRNWSKQERGVLQLELVLERKVSMKQRVAFKALSDSSLDDKVFRMQSKYVKIKLSQLRHILNVKQKDSLLSSFFKIKLFQASQSQPPMLNFSRFAATKLSNCLRRAAQRSLIVFWKKLKQAFPKQVADMPSLIPFLGNFLFVNRRQEEKNANNQKMLQQKACFINLQTFLKRRRKDELRNYIQRWVGCSWLSLQWEDLKGMLEIQQIQNEVMSRQLMA